MEKRTQSTGNTVFISMKVWYNRPVGGTKMLMFSIFKFERRPIFCMKENEETIFDVLVPREIK